MKGRKSLRPRTAVRVALSLVVVPVLALLFASSAAASWSIQTTPNPSETVNEFRGVACPAATNCEAVGRYVYSAGPLSGKSSGFLSSWNGTSWNNFTFEVGRPDFTEDVSCVSSSWCAAIGVTSYYGGVAWPAMYTWNGTIWNISGLAVQGGGETSLRGISCSSTTSCVAVGRQGLSTHTTLTEKWNGSKWETVSSPNPSGSAELNDVSCTSATSCTAVGQYTSGSNVLTLVEVWNGTEWKIVSSPNGAGATTSSLADVSCVSASDCVAVGRVVVSGVSQPLIERWNGTQWSIEAAPETGEEGELSGVACTSSAACTAVGSYKSAPSQVPLALAWNGSTWAAQALANPTPPANSSTTANLTSVSCSSSTACTAVGWYRFVTNGVAGKIYTLAERQS